MAYTGVSMKQADNFILTELLQEEIDNIFEDEREELRRSGREQI